MTQEVTLGEIISRDGVFIDGDWVESKDQDPNGDVRLIQLADIGDGTFLDKSARFLTTKRAKELNCTFLEPGDLLIARMPDPIGRACVFPGSDTPCVTVVDVCIVRPDQCKANTDWLKFMINSHDFRNTISRFITGTTRQRISRGNLSKLKFKLPPLIDQIRIANILSKAEALISQRKESLRLLDEFLKSTFLEMFGDPFYNHKHFTKDYLQNYFIVEPQNGLYKPSSVYGFGTRILRIDSFYNGKIDSVDELKRLKLSDTEIMKYKLAKDQIVINRVNSREYLGKVGLVPELKEPTVFESNMMRFSIDTSRLNPVFLVTLLSSRYTKAQILKYAKDAVNQSSINQQDVKRFEILVPPIKLQTHFAHIVKETEVLKMHYQSSLERLENLYGSLSNRAFKGDLNFKDEGAIEGKPKSNRQK